MNPGWPYPWLIKPWQELRAALQRDTLGAAILVSGPQGVGRHTLIRQLIALSVCEAVRGGATVACGECTECIQLAAGSHPDVLRLSPPEGKQQIAVDDLRALLSALTLTRHYNRRRFVLIDPADALNDSGANALLKTIEEPPAQTHIILVSQRPQELKATVRSRCQLMRLAIPESTIAGAWLAQGGADEAAVSKALQAAGGAPLLAAALMRDGGYEQIESWQKLLQQVESREELPQVLAGRITDAGEADAFMVWLQRELHARCRAVSFGPDTARPADAMRSADHAEKLIAHRRMLKGNVNAKMVLESLFVELIRR